MTIFGSNFSRAFRLHYQGIYHSYFFQSITIAYLSKACTASAILTMRLFVTFQVRIPLFSYLSAAVLRWSVQKCLSPRLPSSAFDRSHYHCKRIDNRYNNNRCSEKFLNVVHIVWRPENVSVIIWDVAFPWYHCALLWICSYYSTEKKF
jgi:hypothetical protein